tara:strand:- start:42 stop:470 length:429 start_codon:yes stop_codon:yes gene_type:complete
MSIEQVVIDAGGPIQTVNLNQGPAGPSGNSILGSEFISSEQAVPASQTAISLAHGLGSVPKSFQWVLKCKSAEEGYSVGDEIDIDGLSFQNSATCRLSLFANATTVNFIYNNKLQVSKADATGVFDVTDADTNWKLVCRAFA